MQGPVSLPQAATVLATCLALAACATPPSPVARTATTPDPVPVAGIGYVLFDAPINRASSADLIADIDRLHAKGAREIDLAINSPGGSVAAAQAIVAEMDRLHAEDGTSFTAYNLHLVASAATLPFLDAQHRYAVPRSIFVFHAPVGLAVGTFTAEALRTQADAVDRAAQTFRDALLARTHLTREQAEIYVTRTVALSPDDARQDGVIDAVQRPTPPAGARAWLISSKPKPPASATNPATSGSAAP